MATTSRGPNWADHTQGGTVFSVAHLSPIFTDYFMPTVEPTKRKPGRAAATIKLHIYYSHHCFTQALAKVQNPDPDHYYYCSARRETRIFCVNRWQESKALPVIVSSISTCFFTRHHNYFVVRNPTNPALGDYFVYFTVKLNRSGGFVDVQIESAYPRLDSKREKHAGKVSFAVLVMNAFRGVDTHTP
jgi:hypothetical protein